MTELLVKDLKAKRINCNGRENKCDSLLTGYGANFGGVYGGNN